MTNDKLDRRKFLKVSTTGVATILVACSQKSSSDDSTMNPDASSSDQTVPTDGAVDGGRGMNNTADAGGQTDVGQDAATADAGGQTDVGQDAATTDAQTVQNCDRTSSDITGPYWREGIPVRSDFDLYGDAGEHLTLNGRVQDPNCTPISNAVIEMWHADPTTVAAEDLTNADTVDYDTNGPEYKYYGQFSTDANGRYEMTTKKPGWYLNGRIFRPSHIHVKIYLGDTERLTTQLYFEGDPFIADDRWASEAPQRAVQLTRNDNGTLSGVFDFTVG